MKVELTTVAIVIILALIVGFLAGMAITEKAWQKEAIRQGNAYYDPETNVFTWNSEG
jgi:hypothetical protein